MGTSCRVLDIWWKLTLIAWQSVSRNSPFGFHVEFFSLTVINKDLKGTRILLVPNICRDPVSRPLIAPLSLPFMTLGLLNDDLPSTRLLKSTAYIA